jgi:ATP-binding cassette, subfamily C, bacterial LapB
VAVLGPNGSGKSTLLRLMSGIYHADRGRVMIDGVDMGQVMPRDLRRNIGYLGQEVRLFAGTLRDNLNLTLLERDDDRLFGRSISQGSGRLCGRTPRGLTLISATAARACRWGSASPSAGRGCGCRTRRSCLLDEPTAALDQSAEASLISAAGPLVAGPDGDHRDAPDADPGAHRACDDPARRAAGD